MCRHLLIALLVVCASRGVHAQNGAKPRAHVMMALPAGADERALVGAFSRASMQFDFHRVARLERDEVLRQPLPGEDVPRVFIDLNTPSLARICIVDGDAQRFLLRNLDMPSGLDEMGREALAQAVESSLSALMESQLAGLSREQADQALALTEPPPPALPPAAPVQPPAPQRRSALRLGLSLGYQAQGFARHMPIVHGPVGGADVAWHESVRLFGNAGFLLPEEARDLPVGVRLSALTGRIGVRWGRIVSPRLALEASGAAGMDVAFVSPQPGLDPQAAPLPATRHYIEVWQLAGTVALTVAPRWQLIFAPQIEGDFRHRHYDIESDDKAVTVLSPLRVRPGLTIGLRWQAQERGGQ
jgi:hypothetical protein